MDAKEVPVSVYDPSAIQPASSEENIENDTLQSSIVNESNSTKTETFNNPAEVVKTENEQNNLEKPIVINDSIEQVILEQPSEPVSQDIEAIASEPLNQIIAETVAEPADIDHSPSLETEEEYVEVYHADATYEVHPSFDEEIMQLEPVNKPIEEEPKKGKNSFFDFFKRWS